MRRLALAVAASAAVAGAGCSALGRQAFQAAGRESARRAACAALGLTGGSLDVMLNVYNPNHYRLDATRLTYQVDAGGRQHHDRERGARQPVHGRRRATRRLSPFR